MKTKSYFFLIITLLLSLAFELNAQSNFYEDFNDVKARAIPSDWSITEGQASGSYAWRGQKEASFDAMCMRFDANPGGTFSVLRTPEITLSSDKDLNFYFKNETAEFSVYVDVLNGDGTETRNLLEANLVSSAWALKTYSLKNYTGKTIKIAFYGKATTAGGYAYFDKVSIEDVSICAYPMDIEMVSVSQNSASIIWAVNSDGGSTPDHFRITVKDEAGAVVGDYDDYRFENDGSYFFTIEGLESSKNYIVVMRSDCEEVSQGLSKYTEEFVFATLCDPIALPYSENFDAEAKVIPMCWLVNPDNMLGVEVTSSFKYDNVGYSLLMKGNASKTAYIVSSQFAHAANDLEVSFMVYGDYGLPFSVGLTVDPLSADAFEVIWEDTIDTHSGWHEVRFCTDVTYYGDQEDLALFISLPAGVDGSDRLYIDNFMVRERPACPRLEDIKVRNILAQSVTLHWTEFGNAGRYEYEITKDSVVIKSEEFSATSPLVSISGLEGNTRYSVRVRSKCAGTEGGEWSLPVEFTTACDVMASNVFAESFEAANSLIPDCWQVKQFVKGYGEGDDYGDQGVDIYTTAFSSLYSGASYENRAKDGQKVLRFRATKGGTRTAIITQAMQMEVAGSYDVSFWVFRHDKEVMVDGVVYPEKFRVLVNNRPDTLGATVLDEINVSMFHAPQVEAPGWYQYDYNIPLSGEVYFMIEAESQPKGYDLYVDDIRVYDAPTCRKIKDIEMIAPTQTEFGLKWAKGKDENSWVVSYRLTNPDNFATIKSGKETVSGAPEFKLSGLTHSTEYRIAGKVASYCGVGDTSVWVEFDYRFMTECDVVSTLPYEENFEGTTFPPVCWSTTSPEGSIERHERTEYMYEGAGVQLEAPGNGQALVTPQFKFTENKEYRISFMMMRNFGDGGIKVMLNDTPDTVGAEELLYIPTSYTETPAETKKGYYQYKADFDAVGNKYLLFVQTSVEFTSAHDYIDKVIVSEKPACDNINDFKINHVTSYTAQVEILDEGVTACEVSFTGVGIAPDAGKVISSESAVIDVTGLSTDTEYDVYVRMVCGNVKGAWSSKKITIKTHCTPFEVTKTTPLEEGFEEFQEAQQLAGCYLREDGGGYFRTEKRDATHQSMVANSGQLYAWMSSGVSAVMYRPLKLKAGVYYEFSAYAIQGGSSSSHISLAYTKIPVVDSLQPVLFEEIIQEEWTKHLGYFQVPEDGIYYFGIKVYAGANIGIDDIKIEEVSCVPPTTGVANLTSNSAAIKVTDMNAGKWLLSVNDFSFTPEGVMGNVFYGEITAEYTDLENLDSNKEYYYAIKSLCSEDEESSWSEVRTFRTRCSAQSLPMTDGFEYDINCWIFLGEYQNVNQITYPKHDGNYSLSLSKAIVVTPELAVESLADYMIEGWIYASAADQDISIGVTTSIDDISSGFEPIGTYHVQKAMKWEKFSFYFNDLHTSDYEHVKDAKHVVIYLPQDDVSFCLDDVEIKLAPTCKQPVETTILEVTENSCTIGWTSKGEESSWRIVGKRGEHVSVDTIVNTNPATVENLLHSTAYDFTIQSVCSESELSEAANVGTVTTECGVWALPYLEDFTGYSYGEIPLCWENLDNGGWFVERDNRIYFPTNEKNKEGEKATILTPKFDLRDTEGAVMTINLANSYADTVTIKLSIDGGETYPIVLGKGYKELPNYTKLTFDLSAYVGNIVRISIEATASGIETSYVVINRFELEKLESCMRPVSLNLRGIGGNSVTIEVNDTTGATAWQYVVVEKNKEGFVEEEIVDVTENPFTINNLKGFTNYALKVRTNCGDKQSSWREIEFKTLCADINSIPYYDSFEEISNVNEGCYTIFSEKPAEQWRPSCGLSWSTYSDGEQSLQMFPSKDYPMFVIMPQFEIPTTSLQLTMDYMSKQTSYYAPDIVVGVMTDATNPASFVEVVTLPSFVPRKDVNDKEVFETVRIPFNVLESEFANARIAIKVGPTLYDNGDACIDNIKIEEVQGCPDVRAIELISTDETSAVVAVKYQSDAVQLAYGLATQDLDSMSRIVSVLDTIELTDLTKGANYIVYARSVCGTDTGEWVQPMLFGTRCDVYTIDDVTMYSESFNSYGNHPMAFPSCYTRLNSVVELGVEYPKLSRAGNGEGDKQVLHLYKDVALALPEFNLPGERLQILFNSCNPSGGTYYKIGLQSDLSDESTFVEVKELYASSLLRQVQIDFSSYKVEGKYIVFKGTTKTSSVYIDNIVVSKAPECFAPTDLKIQMLGDTFAVAVWNHAPAAVKYECELSSELGINKFDVDTLTEQLVLKDLARSTKYVLRMRTICGEDQTATDWVEKEFITMKDVPELPYICGFEEDEENSEWILKNEQLKFVIAGNSNNSVKTGEKALYVADATGVYGYYDYGSSNIYAYRTFLFEAGDYIISYDWKSNGEENRDFGRVFLAPMDIYVTAGNKIGADELNLETYIRLHENDKLEGSPAWTSESTIVSIDEPTNYNLVVQWSNDVSGASNPPLSIDNIRIERFECGVVSNLSLRYVATDSVIVDFVNSGSGEVEWELGTESGIVSGDSISLGGLVANTEYQLKVRPVCDGDVESPWSTLTFTTTCEAVVINEGGLFVEDFETYSDNDVFSNCWTEDHESGSNRWLINNVDASVVASANSGSKFMSLSSRGGFNKNRVMRDFALEGGKYYKVSVYARQSDRTSAYVSLVSTVNAQREVEILVREEVGNIGYQKIAAELFVEESGVYQLGIEGEVSSSSWNVMIDDFSVEALAVGTPVNLLVDAVTESSVELCWLGNGDLYDVEIMQGNVVVNTIQVSDTKASITGLHASTSYKARVRAIKDGVVSDWAELVFNTMCGVVYPPFIEDFEGEELTKIPLCWDNTTHTSLVENIYNWAVFKIDDYSYISSEYGNCVRMSCASTNGYATLETPSIMLDGNYSLSFRYANSSPTEQLKVVVITATATDTLDSFGGTDNNWELARYDLSDYNGKEIKIGFYSTASKASSAHVYVDDVRVICYVDNVVYEDVICEPLQGTVTYSRYGFEVNSSKLKVGENRLTMLCEASGVGECDTLKTLHLTMNSSGTYQYNDTICEGEVYNKAPFENKNLVVEGYYEARLTSACGCDSIVRLKLTVLPTAYAISDTICEGDVYMLGNEAITEAGIYTDTLVNSRGCDSIITLTMSVIPKYFVETRLVCEGDKVEWLDTVLTTSGRYERVYSTNRGCDSVEVMELTVLPAEVEVYDTICLGSTYQFLDTILTDAGDFTRVFQNVLRCDSTVHLHLAVVEPEPTIENDYICEGELYTGYGYNKLAIYQDTMLIQRFSYPDKCDSVVHIYVDYVETIEIDTIVYIAEGEFYEFGEKSLTKAGKYREVFTSAAGCDSIVNLTLEVGTGIDDIYVLSLVIAPNPILGGSTTYINREWTAEEQRGLMLEVVDATGKVVLRHTPTTYPIEVEGLPTTGVYLVRVIDGTGAIHLGRIVVVQ